MNLVTIALWKEWRDHRASVVAFLATIAGLCALAFGFAPGKWGGEPMVPTIAALGGFAVAVLVCGAELAAGELRRDKLAFLARLPIDLAQPFVAKLLFYALVLTTFGAWSYLCATVASATLRHGPWFPKLDGDAWWKWVALVGASWVFAVSCWLPRGTLALPTAAFALATWSAPIVGVFVLNRGMDFRASELATIASWLVVSGIGVAACSFVRGLRHGGPWKRRVAWCVGSASCAFAPLYGWTGMRLADFRHLDPSETTFRMNGVALGVGGRYAFVDGHHELEGSALHSSGWSATHALVVDLDTGSWREAGSPNQHFSDVGGRVTDPLAPPPFVALFENHDGRNHAENAPLAAFDTATAQPLDAKQWKEMLTTTTDALRRVVVLPGGRRCWTRGRKLITSTSDGGERELPFVGAASGHYWIFPSGLGFSGSEHDVYDCTRERAFTPPPSILSVDYVRATKWVVHGVTGHATPRNRMLWNPDTGESSPIRGLGDHDWPIAMAPNGRLVVVRSLPTTAKSTEPSKLALVDPESGERDDVALPPSLAARFRYGSSIGVVAGANDELLLMLTSLRDSKTHSSNVVGAGSPWLPQDSTFQFHLARLDWHRARIDCAGPFDECYTGMLGCPDRDTIVLVEDGRRIVRAHFDGRATETLFPR